MDDLSRREALQLMAGIPLLAAGLSPETVRRATVFARTTMTRPRAAVPVFFTAHEWETVRILVDLIIPRDDRSGSATDAGVPTPKQPVLPFTRPRTDPKDQRQMFVTANMKEWVAAYAQLLSINTTGEMKPMDAGVVEQAARVFGVVYDRLFGPMTQSNKPPVDEDMNDEIPDFRQ